MFLSSAPSALLSQLHPYANTAIFTVLSWCRLNYTEVASLSLRICVKTIGFLYVSSGISSCNSRTPGSTGWRGAAHSRWRVPAPSLNTQGTSDGGVYVWVCVCVCVKEGCREPRSRCRGEAGCQLACQTTQNGFDRRINLGGHHKKFHFEWKEIIAPGCMSCPVPGTVCITL